VSCPVCKRRTDPDYLPFCSRRCADVDLGRWLTGTYAIPTEEGPEDDPAPQTPKDDGARH